MGVASLVMGILGLTVFCWLGPLLGGTWAGALMGAAVIKGQPQIISWPLWGMGLTMGVGLPVISILLGVVAITKPEKKGVALGGIITGLAAAIIGFSITFVSASALDFAKDTSKGSLDQKELKQIQEKLNDLTEQQKIMERLQKAAKTQSEQKPSIPTDTEAQQQSKAQNINVPSTQ